jgi:hypothetical protein
MAGLDRAKKRNSSGAKNKRISRFTEVLGIAQETTQPSGYPDSQPQEAESNQEQQSTKEDIQPSTQPDDEAQYPLKSASAIDKSGYVDTQSSANAATQQSKQKVKSKGSKQQNKQPSTHLNTQPSTQSNTQSTANDVEYPDTQPPARLQSDIKIETNSTTQTVLPDVTELDSHTVTQLDTQLPTQPSVNLDDNSNQPSTHLDTQQPMHPTTQKVNNSDLQLGQVSGYPATQPSTHKSDKLAKRENPDYTQTTFRIPKKLSRDINRVLMNLEDEGVSMDRSDLLEEIAGAFVRLAESEGASAALSIIKNLGTRMDG